MKKLLIILVVLLLAIGGYWALKKSMITSGDRYDPHGQEEGQGSEERRATQRQDRDAGKSSSIDLPSLPPPISAAPNIPTADTSSSVRPHLPVHKKDMATPEEKQSVLSVKQWSLKYQILLEYIHSAAFPGDVAEEEEEEEVINLHAEHQALVEAASMLELSEKCSDARPHIDLLLGEVAHIMAQLSDPPQPAELASVAPLLSDAVVSMNGLYSVLNRYCQ